ncbi:tyrosine-type recombinase/integrase [Streptomyces beijiangensis]|uniref:Tyrosine-type recombinase/integrase n=1 Tax=Streptomyces beijiangensis TaxID=163361 RepID=A0A939F715_9ACTN|nr:tyrosine-type recombinase/integrase [Streptomyces beijiangensis]
MREGLGWQTADGCGSVGVTKVIGQTGSVCGSRLCRWSNLCRPAALCQATQVAEKLGAGERHEGSGYVLVDGLGRALNGRQLRERAYPVMAEHSLRRVRLYDARASCFTYLANKGVPDHLLARWAGHTDVRTTKQWYVKPDVEDLRPTADIWGELAIAPAPLTERM